MFTSTSGLESYSLSVLTDPSIRVCLVYKGSYLQLTGYNSVEELSKNILHRREGFQSAKHCTQQCIYHLEAAIWWYHKVYLSTDRSSVSRNTGNFSGSDFICSLWLHICKWNCCLWWGMVFLVWFTNQVWAEWLEITIIPTEDKQLPGFV